MEYVALGFSKDRETKEEMRAVKKPFYNEFELTEQIKEFVKNTPNDQELGAKIRELFNAS